MTVTDLEKLPKKPLFRRENKFFSELASLPSKQVHELRCDRICPGADAPRKSFPDGSLLRLADSIRQNGVIQPLVVRCLFGQGDQALYELIVGERRLRAAKLIGLTRVPCLILDVDDRHAAELAILENLQREDLNFFEEATAFAALSSRYGMTQEEIARRLSLSQPTVANKLRLLRFTIPEREKILSAGLTERHARALLRLSSSEERLAVIDVILKNHMNVSSSESYIERLLAGPAPSEEKPASSRKIVLKDIRIFYNTIDKAVEIVREAGIPVESNRREIDGATEWVIRVPD